MKQNALAFGAPGIEPRWTSSAKDGIGTAYHSASCIWFTLSHGIINEIYFPHVDSPNTRDLQFLITDGGPHPAFRWAEVSAKAICDLIQIDEASQTKEAVAARRAKDRFRLDLAEVLEKIHAQAQSDARTALATNPALLTRPPALSAAAVEFVVAVARAAATTPFAAHFMQDSVVAYLTRMAIEHLGEVVKIERGIEADRLLGLNPNDPNALACRAQTSSS